MITSVAIYGHGGQGEKGSTPDPYVLVKDEKRVEELKAELMKYGAVLEQEDAAEPITELHVIVKVPYRYELQGNVLRARLYKGASR